MTQKMTKVVQDIIEGTHVPSILFSITNVSQLFMAFVISLDLRQTPNTI